MFRFRAIRYDCLTAIGLFALLTACASNSTVPLAPSGSQVFAPQLQAARVPAPCKGQKTTKKSAQLKETLSTSGGKLCIPAFGGFGGTIQYPAANPSVSMTLTSSTKNKKLSKLGNGKPIFYLQLALSSGTTFGTNLRAGGGLTGKKLIPGTPYTAFGQASAFGITATFTPCYVKAIKGKFGGVIGGLGTLLKGLNVPVAAKGYIEIYPGKQASGKC